MSKLTLVPPADNNVRIRALIRQCFLEGKTFQDAAQVLRVAGFGAQEIMDYMEWSKDNPEEPLERTIEHPQPKE